MLISRLQAISLQQGVAFNADVSAEWIARPVTVNTLFLSSVRVSYVKLDAACTDKRI